MAPTALEPVTDDGELQVAVGDAKRSQATTAHEQPLRPMPVNDRVPLRQGERADRHVADVQPLWPWDDLPATHAWHDGAWRWLQGEIRAQACL